MPAINNSTRWILIGSFQFQPSEFGKIIIIFALARFISDYKDTFKDNQIIIFSFIICLFPLLLIFQTTRLWHRLNVLTSNITNAILVWCQV